MSLRGSYYEDAYNHPYIDVRSIHDIHGQVDSVFQNFLSDSRGSRGIRREDPNKWLPVVDVAEDETDITIQAELPGMKKEDVHLDISNGILTLSGEKKKEKREDNTHFHRLERSYGKFSRSFALPKGVDPSQISAAFKDGVLSLTIPKPAIKTAEKRKIEIK